MNKMLKILGIARALYVTPILLGIIVSYMACLCNGAYRQIRELEFHLSRVICLASKSVRSSQVLCRVATMPRLLVLN
jgi:hypothetical protein